jgi:hypothetical protein
MTMPDPGHSPAAGLRIMMIESELFQIWHEWLAGEVAYLTGQGFTVAQARAIATAEFVTSFGSKIGPEPDEPDEDCPGTPRGPRP